MNTKLSILGIFAFVIGFVLLINFANVFSNYSIPRGFSFQLAVVMVYEFSISMLFFGGILLSFIGFELQPLQSSKFLILIAIIILLLFFLLSIFSLGVF